MFLLIIISTTHNIYLFIKKYLLETKYVPGTVLHPGDTF